MSKKKAKGKYRYYKPKAKPPKRPFLIPKSYLTDLANQVCRMDMTPAVIYNVFKEVYLEGAGGGYMRRIADLRYFRAKQAKHIKAEFDYIKDQVDDEINSRNQ